MASKHHYHRPPSHATFPNLISAKMVCIDSPPLWAMHRPDDCSLALQSCMVLCSPARRTAWMWFVSSASCGSVCCARQADQQHQPIYMKIILFQNENFGKQSKFTSYLTCSNLHSTTPVEPAASNANLSLHSPFSTRTAARFLPKKTFSRYENKIGPCKSGGWKRTFVFSSDD